MCYNAGAISPFPCSLARSFQPIGNADNEPATQGATLMNQSQNSQEIVRYARAVRIADLQSIDNDASEGGPNSIQKAVVGAFLKQKVEKRIIFRTSRL